MHAQVNKKRYLSILKLLIFLGSLIILKLNDHIYDLGGECVIYIGVFNI